MSRTGRPAARRAVAVPPVEMSSTPWPDESLGEWNEAGFVGDGEEGSAYGLQGLVRPGLKAQVRLLAASVMHSMFTVSFYRSGEA